MNGRSAFSSSAQKYVTHVSSLDFDTTKHLSAPNTWSERDILQLREGILSNAIRVLLDGRVSQRVKNEMWLWIQDDDLAPFSFRLCALAAAVNPDKLRDGITWLIRQRSISFKRISTVG